MRKHIVQQNHAAFQAEVNAVLGRKMTVQLALIVFQCGVDVHEVNVLVVAL